MKAWYQHKVSILSREISSAVSLSGNKSALFSKKYLNRTMENVVSETVILKRESDKNTIKVVNEYSCNICETKKNQFHQLKIHLLDHMGAIPYFCTKCSFADISSTQLYMHLISHEEFLSDGEKLTNLNDLFRKMPHSCNLCSFCVENYEDLVDHYISHIAISFICESCHFVFLNETELLIHGHLHSLDFVCQICDKSFHSRRKAFLSHVLSHDSSRLYRNFPKPSISHQDVPFYQPFFEICDEVKLASAMKNVSVLLERLPDTIVRFAEIENDIGEDDAASSEVLLRFCVKELSVAIPKLPVSVTDLASFRKYEKRKRQERKSSPSHL